MATRKTTKRKAPKRNPVAATGSKSAYTHTSIRPEKQFSQMRYAPALHTDPADLKAALKKTGKRTLPKGSKILVGKFKPSVTRGRPKGKRVKYLAWGIKSILIPKAGAKRKAATKKRPAAKRVPAKKVARRRNPRPARTPGAPDFYDAIVEHIPASDIDHHESDLYVKVSPLATQIVDAAYHRGDIRTVATFKSNIDNKMWYDIPFAYKPFWERAERRGKKTNPLKRLKAVKRKKPAKRRTTRTVEGGKYDTDKKLIAMVGTLQSGLTATQVKDRIRARLPKSTPNVTALAKLRSAVTIYRARGRTRRNPGRLAILANPLAAEVEKSAAKMRGEKKRRFLSYYASLKPADQRRLVKGLKLYRQRHKTPCSDFELKKLRGTRVKIEVGVGRAKAIEYHANKGYAGSSKKGVPFRHAFENGQHVVSDENGRKLEVVDRKGAKRKTITTDWIYH